MKSTNRIVILAGVLVMLTLTSALVASKCSGDEEYKIGLKKLGGYNLIKDLRISLKGGSEKKPVNQVIPISLRKGLRYKLYSVNNTDNAGKMILGIYANKQKQVLLGTTYNDRLKKHYESIEFSCQASGSYYLFVSFEGYKKGCGVAFISTK